MSSYSRSVEISISISSFLFDVITTEKLDDLVDSAHITLLSSLLRWSSIASIKDLVYPDTSFNCSLRFILCHVPCVNHSLLFFCLKPISSVAVVLCCSSVDVFDGLPPPTRYFIFVLVLNVIPYSMLNRPLPQI